METSVPLFLAATVGFTHAFEVDHLLAVSSIVTRRKTMAASLRDGMYWGLGHTSTIILVGLLMIGAKVAIAAQIFSYFEAGVGLMLVLIGAHRIWKAVKGPAIHIHEETHTHHLAYSVGVVHGLAGSGTLVLLVMANLKSNFDQMLYLLVFGVGSILGMLLASGMLSLPFSRKIKRANQVSMVLTLLSSLLCIGFGFKIIWENLYH